MTPEPKASFNVLRGSLPLRQFQELQEDKKDNLLTDNVLLLISTSAETPSKSVLTNDIGEACVSDVSDSSLQLQAPKDTNINKISLEHSEQHPTGHDAALSDPLLDPGAHYNSPQRDQGQPSPLDRQSPFQSSASRGFQPLIKAALSLKRYLSFLGPGALVLVAFMDPGNYQALAVALRLGYAHLCLLLVANVMAIFLQVLCARLGAVTGMGLAENCRERLGARTARILWVLTEITVVAADLAEVVGTAVALDVLLHVPVTWGLVATTFDAVIVAAAYRPAGPAKAVRVFETAVSVLVLATVSCFAAELITVKDRVDGEALIRGFLPSSALSTGPGMAVLVAILGATVMPHLLYLGLALVPPKVRAREAQMAGTEELETEAEQDPGNLYMPSEDAVRSTLTYTVIELVVLLFTVALFVNGAILVVTTATLGGTPFTQNADLYTIYSLLNEHLLAAAGTIFALALLFLGLSAGVVCTLAGQMVLDGFLRWLMPPVLRRIVTRTLAIVPCFVFLLLYGKAGLASVLNWSQVVLSLLLPFVLFPLIRFTNSKDVMRVRRSAEPGIELHDMLGPAEGLLGGDYVDMSNGRTVCVISWAVWLLVVALNLYLVVGVVLGWDVAL